MTPLLSVIVIERLMRKPMVLMMICNPCNILSQLYKINKLSCNLNSPYRRVNISLNLVTSLNFINILLIVLIIYMNEFFVFVIE